jgi:hypothetical protein
MKMLIKITTFVVCSFVFTIAYCQDNAASSPARKPLTNFKKLKDGDLVFIKSSTSRAEPIEKLTGSPLTHCGIIFVAGDGEQKKRMVYEGAGRNAPRYHTIEAWQIDESTKKGQDKPDSPLHAVYARRLATPLSQDQLGDLRKRAAELHATQYDEAFQLGNKEPGTGTEYIYCSELIFEAFQKVNLKVGEPHAFKFYYDHPGLSVDEVKHLMDPLLNKKSAQKLRTPEGEYNPDELVISPEDVYISKLLQDVTDQTPD